jgi:hypothetical protein
MFLLAFVYSMGVMIGWLLSGVKRDVDGDWLPFSILCILGGYIVICGFTLTVNESWLAHSDVYKKNLVLCGDDIYEEEDALQGETH